MAGRVPEPPHTSSCGAVAGHGLQSQACGTGGARARRHAPPRSALPVNQPPGTYLQNHSASRTIRRYLPSAAAVRQFLAGRQQRAPSGAAVAMGRLPGNGNRAEARSLGDNVVSGTRVRRRPQARSPCCRVLFCMVPEMPPAWPLLCQCMTNCSPTLAPRPHAQSADEAPARPSVRSSSPPLTSAPTVLLALLAPSSCGAAYRRPRASQTPVLA